MSTAKASILAVLAFFMSVAVGEGQDRRRDEIDDFFRTVPAPSEAQSKEIDTLWRIIRIGNRQERRDARIRLTELGKLAVPFLQEELRSDNTEEARQAAMVLARIGDPSVAESLREVVSARRRARVKGASNKRHAAFALGELGQEEDAALLLKALGGTKRVEQRRAIIWALARLGAEEAAAPLTDIVARGRVQENRSAALIALGRIRSARGAKAIRAERTNGKEVIRRAATLALADLRDPELHGLLAKQLSDRDGRVQRYALIGLSLYQDQRTSQAIRRSGLLLEGDDELAALAVTALGSQIDEKSFALLASRMKPRAKKTRRVKRALAFAFSRRAEPEARKYLAALRADADTEVATAALIGEVLGGGFGAILLDEVVRSNRTDGDLRMAAMELFAYSEPVSAAAALDDVARSRSVKKKVVERARELAEILAGETARTIMRGRVQVMVDDAGGSPEWNLIRAIHTEFLDNEDLDRNLDGRSGGGVRPGGAVRPPEAWTNEEEDMRLWYDLFPYLDRRQSFEVL